MAYKARQHGTKMHVDFDPDPEERRVLYAALDSFRYVIHSMLEADPFHAKRCVVATKTA